MVTDLPELDLRADGRVIVKSYSDVDSRNVITVIGRHLHGEARYEVGLLSGQMLNSVHFESRAEVERLGLLLVALARAGARPTPEGDTQT